MKHIKEITDAFVTDAFGKEIVMFGLVPLGGFSLATGINVLSDAYNSGDKLNYISSLGLLSTSLISIKTYLNREEIEKEINERFR